MCKYCYYKIFFVDNNGGFYVHNNTGRIKCHKLDSVATPKATK
ncbi:hypothetical protein SEA_NICEHOUSE_34 [Rhodococcus phage NiceHouse]|nr:hypothetical protein SEA_NICEHOUSE_34 [Rhodococcus phage NiceHouse]